MRYLQLCLVLAAVAVTSTASSKEAEMQLACAAVPEERRIPCGVYETRKDNMHGDYDFGAACRSRGCCYRELNAGVETSKPNCFWAGAGVDIATAHLIQSNHFDAGFTDQLDAVVNSYFTTFFPGAVALARELRSHGGAERLRWMTQSWLVALYLDCDKVQHLLPVLHCPDAAAVAAFEAAVRRGDVWWHAFPHNAELAAAGSGMVAAGINLTHALDDRFGLARKRTLSRPGRHTRGAPPSRAGRGVLSLGWHQQRPVQARVPAQRVCLEGRA